MAIFDYIKSTIDAIKTLRKDRIAAEKKAPRKRPAAGIESSQQGSFTGQWDGARMGVSSYCSHVTIPRGVFTRFLRENPEFNSAKLRFLQFLCIAERVAVNGVNSINQQQNPSEDR